MGKKIFAVLLLLSFTCAGLQAQNNKNSQNSEQKRITPRVKRDIEAMQYVPIRKNRVDSMSVAQVLQELTIKDQGVASLASIIASYRPFILPSLDELFERAKNNPSVVSRQHEMDFAWRDVVNARQEWMKWVRGTAAYSYGRYNTNLFYQQTNIPTSDTYSQQNASYYLVGGSLTINLFDVFNYNNNVQQKKDAYQQVAYAYQASWQDVMVKISTSYYTIVYLLPIISHSIQWVKLAELSYEDGKLNFIAGRVQANSLFESETQYYRAVQELAANLRELDIHVKFLELATNSKIVPDDTTAVASENSIKDTTPMEYPSNASVEKSLKTHSRAEKKASKNSSKQYEK
jgi:outer membrane protein TolC